MITEPKQLEDNKLYCVKCRTRRNADKVEKEGCKGHCHSKKHYYLTGKCIVCKTKMFKLFGSKY